MKTTFAILAITAFAANVQAGEVNDAFVGNDDTSDTILLDVAQHSGTNPVREPTGHLVPVIASESNYGSVLFDIDRNSGQRTISNQPAIGDTADDYGNILYDAGSRY